MVGWRRVGRSSIGKRRRKDEINERLFVWQTLSALAPIAASQFYFLLVTRLLKFWRAEKANFFRLFFCIFCGRSFFQYFWEVFSQNYIHIIFLGFYLVANKLFKVQKKEEKVIFCVIKMFWVGRLNNLSISVVFLQ